MSRSPDRRPDDPEPASNSPKDNSVPGMYRLVGIGFEFVCTIGAFTLLGWYLDNRRHTSPWYLVTGITVGFAFGLWTLFRSARSAFKD